ncbi:hypothetical protein [Pseudoalteromonas sp. NZS11]|uniref:hypothetical protein n=1 Tax=Pseudoalteromonas sp. NZS11 TaxID=2792049 RepID=UPI0018CD7CBA|nr:hypothetical protein [Pseudoalteromonas sp. NZS11]MBH0078340.1 hypothetical protein [Pseudoalteromonas sp. NZS11]
MQEANSSIDIAALLFSGIISFSIAAYGWYLLNKRANKTALRSETFTLISSVRDILTDIEELAENQLENYTGVDPSKKSLVYSQILESKFLAKFQLLQSRLEYLESKLVKVPDSFKISLRQAMTLEKIDSPMKFSRVLSKSQELQQEIHHAFDCSYNEKPGLFVKNEARLLFLSFALLLIPMVPMIVKLLEIYG